MCSARRRAEALAYECPPAPAVGRHLPLYFVRKGLRPAFGVRRRLVESRRARVALSSPHAEPRRGGQGSGQSKGGGDGQRPAPGDICPDPCLPRRGPSVRGESGRRRACGGRCVLRGAGRRPLRTNVLRRRPLAVTSPFTSYARASALRSEFVGASLRGCRALRSTHRKPSLVGAGRGQGKVKEEVAANGRHRGTFAQAPAHPGGTPQLAESPGEEVLWNPNARQKKTRQREGSAGSGLRGGRDPRNERCVASVVVRVRR